MTAPGAPATPEAAGSRARWWWEIGIVLALSVGASAVYATLSLARSLARAAGEGGSLADQSTQINPPRDDAALWDVIYRFLSFFFGLAIVALVLYLLWTPTRSAFARIGLDARRPGSDLARGVLLVAVIGIPGIGLYLAGRAAGLTLEVQAAPLDAAWWTIPLLVLRALEAGLVEEVVVVAYLFDRLKRVGFSPWAIILSTAVLRGLYHAYQGIGPLFGNIAMGIVFGWCYRRWGRVMPLVVAHVLIDVIAFIGYPLAVGWWPGLFA